MAERRTHPRDLRQRLIVVLLVPLLLILMGSSVLDFRLAKRTADAAHDQALADNVFDLESHIRQKATLQELDLSDEIEAMLRSNAPDTLYYAVRDGAGRTLSGDADLPPFEAVADSGIRFADGRYRGQDVRMAGHRVSLGSTEVQIVVMETTEKRIDSSRRILTAMVLPNLAVIVATLLAVVWGVRRGLLPLSEVEQEIGARSPGDLHEIDLAAAPREIHPLLERLNELFRLLREAAAVQQRFIADAAHQLRTPLAGLQTQIDLAAGEGDFGRNPERRARIEEATRRIGHLLNQLLVHARADSERSGEDAFSVVQLGQLVEKSATIFLDAALAKNIDLGFEIVPVAVRGIPWMLQEALGNLIDNAIRYTPQDGVINVRCGERDGKAFIEVEDSGPGIADEHLPRVCERFYRIPGSPGDGCGLGLAIVGEIGRLHGAGLQFGRSELGGLRIGLVFSGVAEAA